MTAADAAVDAAADTLAEKVERLITHRTVESGRRRRSDWGARGRGFESRHPPDQLLQSGSVSDGSPFRSAVLLYGLDCAGRLRRASSQTSRDGATNP
jgi:hypothetical protein